MKKKVLIMCYDQYVIDDQLRVPKNIEIYAVTSLEIARELVEELHFTAVFTEIRINRDRMAGYKLMKYAKENSKNKQICVYAFGKDKVNSCRSWAKNIGFNDFYCTPTNVELLLRVDSCINQGSNNIANTG